MASCRVHSKITDFLPDFHSCLIGAVLVDPLLSVDESLLKSASLITSSNIFQSKKQNSVLILVPYDVITAFVIQIFSASFPLK